MNHYLSYSIESFSLTSKCSLEKIEEDVKNQLLDIDDKNNIIWNFKSKIYIIYKGDLNKIKNYKYYGKRAFQLNNIKVFYLKQNNLFYYNCITPNNKIYTFKNVDKKNAYKEARIFCLNNKKYAKRDTVSRFGNCANVPLTFNNLYYLLNIIPINQGNNVLIKKLKKAFNQSKLNKERDKLNYIKYQKNK